MESQAGHCCSCEEHWTGTAQVTVLSSGCCIRNNNVSLQQTFVGSWEKALLLGEVQIHSCTSPGQKVLMLLMLIGTRQE